MDFLQALVSLSPSTPPSTPPPSTPPVSHPSQDKANSDIRAAVNNLMKFLLPGFDVMKTYKLALIISFDEAHPLAKIEAGPWSRFSELRRVLQIIHSYPCFTVFLSTTGKVNQFMPQPKHDISNRVQQGVLKLFPPFCELGFDQLACMTTSGKTIKTISGELTLDTIASLEFMATLSRPL